MVSRLAILLLASFFGLGAIPGLSAESPPSPAASSRLNSSERPLETLFPELRKISGKSLWVSPAIAQEKVAVSVKGGDPVLPALDLLPGYQWLEIIPAKGKISYLLAPDWGERRLWEQIKSKAETYKEQETAAAGKARLKVHFRALALSPDELKKLADSDPWLVWALSQDFPRQAMVFLSGLSERELDKIFFTPGLQLHFAELPLPLQSALAIWLHEQAEDEGWQGPGKPEELELILMNYAVIGFGNCPEGLVFGLGFPNLPSNLKSPGYLGETLVRPEGLYVADGRFMLRLEEGMPKEQARQLMEQEMAAARSVASPPPVASLPRFGSRLVPAGELSKDLTAGIASGMLAALGEDSGLPIVWQYFSKFDIRVRDSFAEGTPLAAALDGIANSAGYIWAYDQGALILTRRDLAEALRREIPDRLLEKWRKRAKERGGRLTLDDLAEMAPDLSNAQGLGLPNDLIRAGAMSIRINRKYLLFYGALTPAQRKAAWSEQGLPGSDLSEEQRAQFVAAAYAFFGDARPKAVIPASFQAKADGRATVFVFNFRDGEPQLMPMGIRPSPPGIAPSGQVVRETGGAGIGASFPPVKTAANDPGEREAEAAFPLSYWNFAGRMTKDNEAMALLETRRGDDSHSRLLKVGDMLEGARLISIDADGLTFSIDDSMIKLPESKLHSLAPPYVARPDLAVSSQ